MTPTPTNFGTQMWLSSLEVPTFGDGERIHRQ
jgi:hypothetical protein